MTGFSTPPVKALTIGLLRLAHALKISPLGPYHYKMIAENFIFNTQKIRAKLGWMPSKTNEEMLWDHGGRSAARVGRGKEPAGAEELIARLENFWRIRRDFVVVSAHTDSRHAHAGRPEGPQWSRPRNPTKGASCAR